MIFLYLSRSLIAWETGFPDCKAGDVVEVKIPRFGIDGTYTVAEVEPFGVTLEGPEL